MSEIEEYVKSGIEWIRCGDILQAENFFRYAVSVDSAACDAWMGLAYCLKNRDPSEAVTDEIIRGAHTSLEKWGEISSMAGIAPGALAGEFHSGIADIKCPFASAQDIRLAHASSLIQQKNPIEAEEYLHFYFKNNNEAAVLFVKSNLYYQNKVWTDLQLVSKELRKSTEVSWSILGEFFLGTAMAHLQQLTAAQELLINVAEQGSEDLAALALTTVGLICRENKNEKGANHYLSQAYQYSSSPEVLQYLEDPQLHLEVSSKDAIESRSNKFDPRSGQSISELKASEINSSRAEILEEAETDLQSQIGMAGVKKQITMLKAGLQMAKMRAEKGIQSKNSKTQHMTFVGPPGTGKTTIARIVAKIYMGLGIAETPNVVEATRGDFVAAHLGGTAPKTDALIDRALGGVLFVDEAYTLYQEGLSNGDAFGKEAIDTLLKRMEDDRDRLIVILAGYEKEIDNLLKVNEGLASRIPLRITFNSYSAQELTEIADLIAKTRNSEISAEAKDLFVAVCQEKTGRLIDNNISEIDKLGNGRWVRTVIEKAEAERDYRLITSGSAELSVEEMTLIDREDMAQALDAV